MKSTTAIALWILAAAATVLTVRALNPPEHSPVPDVANHSPATSTRAVVDSAGFTVYRFDQMPQPVAQRRTDPRIDPSSDRRLLDCDGGVSTDWPLVVYRPDLTLRGVDPGLLGHLERADGTRQLTIDGCPVYRHVGDSQPGQTTGHGKAGVWLAVTAAGTEATPTGRAACRSMWCRSVPTN
jgi:hypothetical protein